MSGLLRRIKRSRSADAGETHAEGQAAGPEGAPTTAETAELPAGAPVPAVKADPNTPAGLDPAEPVATPAGRRGRLRRRLRYLRRARELMLRDLGGLLYEVHRSGGGDVAAHAGVIGGKLERLARLDAEAAAIETALGARRSEAVVFEPGIGGTCAVCGELYGSAARFCSHCGTPTATPTAAATKAEPRPVPPMPKASASTGAGEERTPANDAARELEGSGQAAGDEAGRTPEPDRTRELEGSGEAAGDETGEIGPTRHPRAADDADTGQRSSGRSNGRAEDRSPGLASGDPLAARDRS